MPFTTKINEFPSSSTDFRSSVVMFYSSCFHTRCHVLHQLFSCSLSCSTSVVFILVVMFYISCFHTRCHVLHQLFSYSLSCSISVVFILVVMFYISCFHTRCHVLHQLFSYPLSCSTSVVFILVSIYADVSHSLWKANEDEAKNSVFCV